MDRDEILRTNRRVYDQMAAAQDPLCRPATTSELADPLATVDAIGWLGDSIAGRRVLCLAAGGGRHSALYSAAGANVTVVDISSAMLELDRAVAAERGFAVRLIEASMDDLSMFDAGEFDVVIHPVSTCYIEDIRLVFEQVAHVLRDNGLYISQHKQPTSLQATTEPSSSGHYTLQHSYYRQRSQRNEPIPSNPRQSAAARRLREAGAIEFLHRWEEIVGGMCRAGFAIEDLVEPMHAEPNAAPGTFAHRAHYVAPYVRIKARRRRKESSLWLPS